MPLRRVLALFCALVAVIASACHACSSAEQPAAAPTTPPVEMTESEAPHAEPVPIADRCSRAAERAAEILGEHASEDMAAPLRECIGISDGAWMLMPTTVHSEELSGEDPYGMGEPGEIVTGTATTITYRAGYLAPNGETYFMGGNRTVSVDTYNQSSDSVVIKHAFDYDGDGHQELMLSFREHVFDEGESSEVFWTFDGGEITDYAPASDINIEDLVDHDDDGRMDLVSAGDFYPSGWGSNNDGSVDGTPPVLFHSLPDGTFTASDEVAASYLREACPAPPTVIIPENFQHDVFGVEIAVTCARLWGASVTEVRARIDAELPRAEEREREGIRESLRARADVEPPLTLTPLGPFSWYCLCYRDRDAGGRTRDATACRRSPEPCSTLQARASRGAGSMVSLIRDCRHVGDGEHPAQLLGPAAWEPSSRAGAWWVEGQCVMPEVSAPQRQPVEPDPLSTDP